MRAIPVLLSFLGAVCCHAETLTWTGATDNVSFAVAGNWSPALVPGANSDCVIPSGSGVVYLSAPASVKSVSAGRMLLLGNCATLTLAGDLNLVGGALVKIDDPQGCSMIRFGAGTHAITGQGDIFISNNANTGRAIVSEAGGTLTIGSDITVRIDNLSVAAAATVYVDSGSTLINQGRLASRVIGKTLSVAGPGTFTNEGTLEASGGKIIAQPGTWSSTGTIALSGTGEFAAAGSYPAIGPVSRTGGTLRLTGACTGPAIEASASTGPMLLSNFSASNATLRTLDPISAPIVIDGYAFLNNCTIASNISIQNCGAISVSSGLAFANSATLTVDLSGSCISYPLVFDGGTHSVSGSGTVAFKRAINSGDPRACVIRGNASVTIESGVTFASSSGTPATFARIDVEAGSTLINKGRIAANVAGLSIFLSGAGTLQNLGTLEATAGRLVIEIANWSNGGTLHLTGTGAMTLGGAFPSLGTIDRSGGTLILSGAFGGGSLEASAATGDIALLGSLSGITLKSTGDARFVVMAAETGPNTAVLNACTLEGKIDIVGSATLEITGGLTLVGATVTLRATVYNKAASLHFSGGPQSLSGNGEILYADRLGTAQISVGQDCHLTLGPGISVHDLPDVTGPYTVKVALDATAALTNNGTFEATQPDRTLQFSGGTLINNGLLIASAGTLEVLSAWTNNGFYSLTEGATLSLGGTYSGFGPIDRPGGTVVLRGTFTGTLLSTGDLGGDVMLNDVSISNATMRTTGNSRFLVRGMPTLTGCTLAGTLVNGECSTTTIRSGLTLDNATVLFGPTGPCSPLGSTIYLTDGTQSLGGNGAIQLGGGMLSISGAVTFEPGVAVFIGAPGDASYGSILVNSGASLVSRATITAGSSTETLRITGNGTFANLGLLRAQAGTLEVRNLIGNLGGIELNPAARLVLNGNYTIDSDLTISSGGRLSFSGNWTNNAIVTSDHGTLTFGGTWTNAGTFHVSNSNWNIGGVYPSLGNYTSTSNTLALSGTFPGTSLVADASTGDISLGGITFNNATLSASDGAKFVMGTGVNLNGCTLATDITLGPCSRLVVTGGLTLADVNISVILSCKNNALAFSGPSQTLGGTGTVRILTDWTGIALEADNEFGSTLTIAPGITVSLDAAATDPAASLSIPSGSIINQGVIEILRPGGTLSITGAGTFINQGHLSIPTGTLNIANLSGPLGSVTLAPGASLSLAGAYSIATPLNILAGSTLSLNGTWTNSASLNADNATLIMGGTWSNTGSFTVTDSAWTIGGSYPSLGTHAFSNTALTYSGTFPGTSLIANAATGDIRLGTLALNNATLDASDGATFTFTDNATVTLNACTIATDLTVGPCAAILLKNGLTLANNAAVRVRTPTCPPPPVRVAGGSQFIGGAGRILYDNAKSLSLLYADLGTSVTVGPGIFLGFDPDSAATTSASITRFTNLVNQGTIAAASPGRQLSISNITTFNNQGILESTAGTLAITSVSAITNYNTTTKTLTGGTWRALGGSLIMQSFPLSALGPGTELAIRGQSISTPNLAGLASNAGTLRVADRTLALPAFTNSGTLDLGPGALFNIGGVLSLQPEGLLRVEIAGLAPSQFGRLASTGAASIAGTLTGAFVPPYTPIAGDVASPFVSALSLDGAFASVCFDANPSLLGVAPIASSPTTLDLLVTADSGFAPTIRAQPSDSSSPRTAVLTVEAGPANANFRWRRASVPLDDGPTGTGSFISGAHTPTLVVSNLSPADAGGYDVAISTPCAEVISQTAVVRLCPGDLNNDGIVDDADFVDFLFAYNLFDCADPDMPLGCPADLDADGFVNDSDFQVFVLAYNALLCP